MPGRLALLCGQTETPARLFWITAISSSSSWSPTCCPCSASPSPIVTSALCSGPGRGPTPAPGPWTPTQGRARKTGPKIRERSVFLPSPFSRQPFYHCSLLTCDHPHQTISMFQVSIMFIVVLIVFGVCWLPYHAYFIYNYYTDISSQVTQLALCPIQ